MRYKAVFFDFDYTLANLERGRLKSYRAVLTCAGIAATDEAILNAIRQKLDDGLELLTGSLPPEQTAPLKALYEATADEELPEGTVVFDTVEPMLWRLRDANCRAVIVSTKFRYRILETLKRYRLETAFDLVIGSEDVAAQKPDPEGVRFALEKLALQRRDVLFVGDSLVDAKTAQNAGLDFSAVLTGVTSPPAFAGYPCIGIMKDLSELK